MNRDYLFYVGEACEKGMNPEEVQILFKSICKKAEDRKGKAILRMFCKGIGGAKREYAKLNTIEQVKTYQYVNRPY